MKKSIKVIIVLSAIVIVNILLNYCEAAYLTPYLGKRMSYNDLTKYENTYCIARGQSAWDDSAYISRITKKTAKNDKLAYILSQNKLSRYSNTYSESLHHSSIPQNAVWQYLNQGYYTNPSSLMKTAGNFEIYRQNYQEIKQETTNVETIMVGETTIIGPYKVSYSSLNEFGKIKSITLTGEVNGENKILTEGSQYYLSKDSDGSSRINCPKSNEIFYIVITDMDVTKVNKLKFVQENVTITVEYYSVEINGGQNMIIHERPVKKVTNAELEIDVNVYIVPPFEFSLVKKDFANNNLQDVTFKLSFNNVRSLELEGTKVNTQSTSGTLANGVTFTATTNNIVLEGLKTDSNGRIEITEIRGLTVNDKVLITVEETNSKVGYKELPGVLYLESNYDKVTKDWLLSNRTDAADNLSTDYYSIDKNNITVELKNNSIIEKLIILKRDPLNESANLDGAEFEIEFENISNYTNKITRTVKNGKLELEDLEIADLDKDIIITIRETKTPEGCSEYYYKEIKGDIIITLKREAGSYIVSRVETTEGVLKEEVGVLDVNNNTHEVSLIINNLEAIRLSGQVWKDGQIGNKDVSESYNGIIDASEEKVKGVKVHLYSVKEGRIISEETKVTDENGKYEFVDVIRTEEGYDIYFEYNGILYNDVGIFEDSDASDNQESRETVNNRFKTIEKGIAIGTSGENTILEYNYTEPSETIIGYSELIAQNDGSVPSNSSVIAETDETYNKTTENIDCGLIEKYYDLRIDNLINNVKYTINGKELTENAGNQTTYSTSMYNSDYYYRFDNYGDQIIEEFDDEILRKDTLQTAELEAYVTYELKVINQNTNNTQSVDIEYRYDTNIYELISVNGETQTDDGIINLRAVELSNSVIEKSVLIVFKLKKVDGEFTRRS